MSFNAKEKNILLSRLYFDTFRLYALSLFLAMLGYKQIKILHIKLTQSLF